MKGQERQNTIDDDSPNDCPKCNSENVKKVYQPQPERIPNRARWILDRCRDCKQMF